MDSVHVYKRHYDLVNRMLEKPFINVQMPAVTLDLIEPDGKPTPMLWDLHNNIEEPDDLLYSWIFENINIKNELTEA